MTVETQIYSAARRLYETYRSEFSHLAGRMRRSKRIIEARAKSPPPPPKPTTSSKPKASRVSKKKAAPRKSGASKPAGRTREEYEVNYIDDFRITSYRRAGRDLQRRQYLVYWRGYEKPTWKSERKLLMSGAYESVLDYRILLSELLLYVPHPDETRDLNKWLVRMQKFADCLLPSAWDNKFDADHDERVIEKRFRDDIANGRLEGLQGNILYREWLGRRRARRVRVAAAIIEHETRSHAAQVITRYQDKLMELSNAAEEDNRLEDTYLMDTQDEASETA